MYNLFNFDPGIEYGIVHLPEWTYLKDGLRRNLDTVLEFYRHASYSVAGDHLLVKILQSIAIPLSLTTERYYSNVFRLALTLASPFQLTSSINSGRIFNGLFYGKGNREIIVAVDEWFNPHLAENDWQNLVPVKVLRHPFTDLMMNIPNGKDRSREAGIVVLSINIPMLAIQYRAFCAAEKVRVAGTHEPVRNMMQFIAMYVLPNMLGSHVDQVLFNRFTRVWNLQKTEHGKADHPFYLADYDKKLTGFHLRLTDILRRSNYNFGATLSFIPGLMRNDMEKAMLLPDVVPTRQVLWSLVLARLPMLLFLISSAKYGTKMRNQLEVDQIGETMLQLRRQRVFESALPGELFRETMGVIDTIIKLTNSPTQV